MTFSILHLNVEKSRHTNLVLKLLEDKKPEIVCLAEAMHKDVEMISSKLGYTFAFSPLQELKNGTESDQEGSAILSKYPILNIEKHRYDDGISVKPPVRTMEEETFNMKSNERPSNRFLNQNTLLTGLIKLNEKQTVTISTTHFPVTDHTTPGYKDHEIKNSQNVDDMEHSEIYLDRLINIIRSLTPPIVFTSDLNNPRGEYFYDLLAHELVDQVPSSLESSLDPYLHRVKNLKLVVDTIMTSPDISLESFEVIEGVSDHKAFFVSLNL